MRRGSVDPAGRMDLLWILPLIGVVLLSPAVLSVFDRPIDLFGVPLLFVYVFSAWLIGVLVTRHVARLAAAETPPNATPKPAGAEAASAGDLPPSGDAPRRDGTGT